MTEATDNEKSAPNASLWPLRVAFGLTVGWLIALLVLLGLSDTCQAGRWFTLYVECLKPNEVGDLLAGAFAPMAFFWVAAAVLIQAQELKAQREELRQSRMAATNQAKTASAQLDTLLEEKEDRNRKSVDDEVFEGANDILFQMTEVLINLEFEREGARGTFNFFRGYDTNSMSAEQKWLHILNGLHKRVGPSGRDLVLFPNEHASRLAAEIEGVLINEPKMSRTGKIRLKSLSLIAIADYLRIWGNGRDKGATAPQ